MPFQQAYRSGDPIPIGWDLVPAACAGRVRERNHDSPGEDVLGSDDLLQGRSIGEEDVNRHLAGIPTRRQGLRQSFIEEAA